MILLDTNIVVAYLNDHADVAQRMASRLPEIALPSLVVAELYYGARASARAEENLAKLDRLCSILPVISFDLAAARLFGTLKSELRKRGKPTGETDAWIAAMSLAHSATLVTHNTRDFEHIPGLAMEDWLASSS